MQRFGDIVRIHPLDNVVVALKDLAPGDQIVMESGVLQIEERIPRGHKVALCEIGAQRDIIKYGYPIGRAAGGISPGTWVHSHNLHTLLEGLQEYVFHPVVQQPLRDVLHPNRVFEGYVRSEGDVGIRNEIWILPTVGCVNKTAEKLAQVARERFCHRSIDGIYSFGHPYGCSQLGDDHSYTQRILAGLARHPNAGGVLIIGLGCENNHIQGMRDLLGDMTPGRVAYLNTQDVGDEIEEGLALLTRLVSGAETCKRRPVPVSRLRLGLKCGGSDGFSGITANPLIGVVSDQLIGAGGTSILTEVPEMFGAETILMDRCTDEGVFQKTVRLINDFKAYFLRYGQPVYENPSPGNKEGGITTLEEKSLGCTQKGGDSPVTDVLEYGEQVVTPGLVLLNGPGNDIVSTTAMCAAGAHIILFSTGRGTPLGSPVPTVKISSNSGLAGRKPNWIDFNAGSLLEGRTVAEASRDLMDLILAVASGRQTRNEEGDYREIAIFKDGVTL